MNIAPEFSELRFGKTELDFFNPIKKEKDSPEPETQHQTHEAISDIAIRSISPSLPTDVHVEKEIVEMKSIRDRPVPEAARLHPKPVRRYERHKARGEGNLSVIRKPIVAYPSINPHITTIQRSIDQIMICTTTVLNSDRHPSFLVNINQLLTHLETYKKNYLALKEAIFAHRAKRETLLPELDKYCEIFVMVQKMREILENKVKLANLKIAAFNTAASLGFIVDQINAVLDIVDREKKIKRCRNNYLVPGLTWYGPNEMKRIIDLCQSTQNHEQQLLIQLFHQQNQSVLNYQNLVIETKQENGINAEMANMIQSMNQIKIFLIEKYNH